ncbi:MAG: hypothetical protein H7Y01_02155 [Ferruginibacter sp.]|nr:hypothetical protein [Chitinophagaceae bacterium]
MENLNFHKQKLYSLICAAAALIALLLPWAKVSYGGYGGGSVNGLHGEGFITLLGIGAVAAACFMGDKMKSFEGNFRNIALGGFVAIIAGAVIAMINVMSKGRGIIKPGLGLWLAIAAGAVGLLFLLGIIKFPDPKPKV